MEQWVVSIELIVFGENKFDVMNSAESLLSEVLPNSDISVVDAEPVED